MTLNMYMHVFSVSVYSPLYLTTNTTRREKYSNVLETHIVIVGQVRICRFSPKFDIASRDRLHID